MVWGFRMSPFGRRPPGNAAMASMIRPDRAILKRQEEVGVQPEKTKKQHHPTRYVFFVFFVFVGGCRKPPRK